MKVGVPGADLADAVLSHQDGGVRVVHDVAFQVGHLVQNLVAERPWGASPRA